VFAFERPAIDEPSELILRHNYFGIGWQLTYNAVSGVFSVASHSG
jgi:hypothetical protein